MVTEKYKSMLIEIILKRLSGTKIYLFGSRAKGYSDSGSDIDLALDNGEKIEFKILLDIADDITNSTLPYFVDVIDIHAVDQKFYQAIKEDLIPWKM